MKGAFPAVQEYDVQGHSSHSSCFLLLLPLDIFQMGHVMRMLLILALHSINGMTTAFPPLCPIPNGVLTRCSVAICLLTNTDYDEQRQTKQI